MAGISFTNNTGRKLFLMIEPIAEEYDFLDGDHIEIDGDIYIDNRKTIDVRLDQDVLAVFVSEDAEIKRNGERISPTIS